MAFAQEMTVSGRVTDAATGEGLPSVTIRIKGTGSGVVSDIDGNYTIKTSLRATLAFSFVNYLPTEVVVGSQSVINVTLQEDAKTLNEVVVIGYGTAKKRDLTGTAVKINGDEVAEKPNVNPLSSLQGKASGVQVTNSGTPGQGPDIRIRGTVSTGTTRPLYLVDGIFNDDISYINPSDIESIEVLKDASSLAIFGVRGANGVIAITTKKAKAGKLSVNINSMYGFKKLSKRIEMVDAAQFRELYEEERRNIGDASVFDYTPWTGNTNWIDQVTRTGIFSANNLSITSATEKNRLKFGIGHTSDEGIIKGQKLTKVLLSFNDEVTLTKFFKMGVNVSAMRQNSPWSDANAQLEQARRAVPIANPYGPDGVTPSMLPPFQNSGIVNPLLAITNEPQTQKILENRIVGSLFAEVSFLKNFNFRATWYGDYSTVNNRNYNGRYDAYYPITGKIEPFSVGLTQVEQSDATYKKFQQDYILNYTKTINGKHNIAGTAGATTYEVDNVSTGGIVKQGTDAASLPIPNDERFWYLNNGFGDPNSMRIVAGSTWQNQRSTLSYLFRGMYNYDHKYYLSASYRRDGSSAFLPDYRWQDFYAVGAAWEVTSEDFLKNNRYINYLKVKGSYGQLGNQNTYGYDYPAYPGLKSSNSGVFGGNLYPAYSQEYLPDPKLHWETILSTEFGLELVALNNRLSVDAAYYNRESKDLMTIIPGVNGAQDGLTNIGSVRSRGFELSATWTQSIGKDLSMSIGGNFTTLNNKVLSLVSNDFAIVNGVNRVTQGLPLAYFYGYTVDGLYQSEADIAASPDVVGLGAVKPGDVKFRDVNGDGKVDANDRTMIGNPTPDFMYGGNVSVKYKGFDLGVKVQGVYGNEIYRLWNSTESEFQRVNYAAFQLNRWHGAGTSNWQPILGADHRINYQNSTLAVEDGSYFRIRNLQLGYNFPRLVLDKLNMQNLRAFINVQNVKTWANNSGYTPEFGSAKTSNGDKNASISIGNDSGGGAIPVITTFGINLTF
ncbi:TonB-dependent receptor [Spirosoma harenae]